MKMETSWDLPLEWKKFYNGVSPDGSYSCKEKVLKSAERRQAESKEEGKKSGDGRRKLEKRLSVGRGLSVSNHDRNQTHIGNGHEIFASHTGLQDSSGSESSTGAMPYISEGGSRPQSRSARGQRFPYHVRNSSQDSKDFRVRSANSASRKPRKTPKATEISPQYNTELTSIAQKERPNPEEKFLLFLAQNLRECSRQRLRSVHMSLRQYSNVEARISQKDLNQALLENHVKLSGRIYQHLITKFEDHQGINFEKLYKYLTEAHLKSGRDSVLAMQKRNDLEAQPEVSQEERDADLLRRLEDLLVKDRTFFDLSALREAFQSKDKDKTGKLDRNEMMDICSRLQLPLYGALLKSLIRRCDEERNEIISWPEFVSFLEISQQSAWKKHPELEELPQKVRAKTPVVPDPIDGLSENTRNKLVNKLLKKASLNKGGKQFSSPAKVTDSVADENMDEPSKPKESQEKVSEQNPQEEMNQHKTEDKAAQENESKDSEIQIDSPTSVEPKKQMSRKKFEAENAEPLLEMESTSDTGQENPAASTVADSDVKEAETASEVPQKEDSGVETISLKVRDKNITFTKPSDYESMDVILDPPKERLKLDWVYGYRGNDCRSNIYVLATEEILYFISNIAILYNSICHKQRHYREHTEDIKCIAVHSNGCIVASGQFYSRSRPQNQAHIRVWRADTLETMYVMGAGMFERAVMCLTFAKDRDILAAVDNSQEKKLTIWNTATGTFVAETLISTEVICDVSFNTKNPDVLVTTGKEHLAWWKIYEESGTIQPLAQPDYENYMRAKFVICLTHNEKGDLITGDSNGTIYVWADGGNKITNFIKHSHDGPVFTVLSYKSHILSGGRDGMIYSWVWNKNMDKVGSVTIPKSEGGVRMLQSHQDTLLVGTTMNSMLSLVMNKGQGSPLDTVTLDPVPITQGHYDDLRGMTTVRSTEVEGNVITAGQDGIIGWFDTGRQDPVCKLVLKGVQFLCVDVSPSGKMLVLGTKDGHLLILAIDGESSTEVLNQKICKERINCIKLSPDCKQIAAGSQDKSIYVYKEQVKDEDTATWEFVGKCKGHNGPVHSLDWSKDKVDNSHYVLRSCSAGPEQRFWNMSTLERVSNSMDSSVISWRTGQCKLDVKLSGLWSSKHAVEGELNCVDVCFHRNLVAMGDNHGHISLFRYPSYHRGVFCHTYRSHTSVHNLVFSPDGDFLISIGGRDSSIIQWKVI